MARLSKPVQWIAAGVIVLLLGIVAAAGLVTADDGVPFAKDDRVAGLFERAQVEGWWMGMRLGQADNTDGVKILEVSDSLGWRAKQAGVMPGDIITGINGKKVTDLSDLQRKSVGLNLAGPVALSVTRFNQQASLVIPPLPPPISQQPVMPAQMPVTPMVPGGVPVVAPNGAEGPAFYCPRHRVLWTQAQVHPSYRCPLCSGPLVQQ